MDLCVLSDVKACIGIADNVTDNDEVLQLFIAGASRQIERYLARGIETTARTEYYDATDGQDTFIVRAYPITTITSVKNSAAWEWSTTTALSSTYLHHDGYGPMISVYTASIVGGRDAVQIVYTGGMATDTVNLRIGDFADVSLACVEYVCAIWNNRTSFGVSQAAIGGQRTSAATRADIAGAAMPPSVREILKPFRRRSYGI